MSQGHINPGNGPAKFKKMEKNAGGGRVVAMLEEVLADSKKTEDEALRGARDAAQAYCHRIFTTWHLPLGVVIIFNYIFDQYLIIIDKY